MKLEDLIFLVVVVELERQLLLKESTLIQAEVIMPQRDLKLMFQLWEALISTNNNPQYREEKSKTNKISL
jgi:predicted glycosyl hydrolase (DUF1957 family)